MGRVATLADDCSIIIKVRVWSCLEILFDKLLVWQKYWYTDGIVVVISFIMNGVEIHKCCLITHTYFLPCFRSPLSVFHEDSCPAFFCSY